MVYEMRKLELNKVYCIDCLKGMRLLLDNSVDSVVTDPPAGISFMGKSWDTFDKKMFGKKGEEGINDLKVKKNFNILPRYNNSDLMDFQNFICEVFTEVIRVLKPGGYCLVWAIPRTSHHTAMGLERAGFEIRDCVYHIFGTGFPKSLNIGKSIDKQDTIEFRKEIGNIIKEARNDCGYTMDELCNLLELNNAGHGGMVNHYENGRVTPTIELWNKICEILNITRENYDKDKKGRLEIIGKRITNLTVMQNIGGKNVSGEVDITISKTAEAKEWDGWGTALKPAVECWWLCRKPLSEKSVALNVLKWGTGGINIDECRIGNEIIKEYKSGDTSLMGGLSGKSEQGGYISPEHKGRFPANIIFDEEAGRILDEQSGDLSPQGNKLGKTLDTFGKNSFFGGGQVNDSNNYKDSGGASRFFYCAKASKSERNRGLNKSFINIEVSIINGDDKCKEKSLIQEEKLVRLQVNMDTLQLKVIEEYGIKNKKDYEWNTTLFGKNIMESFQKSFQTITKMGTNLITQSKILNWLTNLLIQEYIVDVKKSMENGGNLAENVGKYNILTITINEKMGLALGVKNVVLGMQLKINIKEIISKCTHPTVKSLKLMEYLVRLVTRKGGVVLDPFGGSGSTGIACVKQGFKFILFDNKQEYCDIANARLKPFLEQGNIKEWFDGGLRE